MKFSFDKNKNKNECTWKPSMLSEISVVKFSLRQKYFLWNVIGNIKTKECTGMRQTFCDMIIVFSLHLYFCENVFFILTTCLILWLMINLAYECVSEKTAADVGRGLEVQGGSNVQLSSWYYTGGMSEICSFLLIK